MPPGRNTQEYSSAAGIIKYILTRERDPFRYLDNPAIGGGKAEAPKMQVYAPPVGEGSQAGPKERERGRLQPLEVDRRYVQGPLLEAVLCGGLSYGFNVPKFSS